MLTALLIGGILSACKQGNVFQVNGTIEGAAGDTLYLEQRALAGITLLDSTILKKGGAFSFKEQAPANPEFYQLRLANQVVAFVIDSTETLQVTANATDLYRSFNVADSPVNSQLREVDDRVQQTAMQITSLENRHKRAEIDDMTFLAQLDSALQDYKGNISRLILGNPGSAVAYYALF